MPDYLLAYLIEHVNSCAAVAGLGHIRITVEFDPECGDFANINVTPDSYEAHIVFGPPFLEAGPVLKNEVIGHELQHIHIWPITNLVERVVDRLEVEARASDHRDILLPFVERLRGAFGVPLEIAEELATDNTGRVLAPFLPPWEEPHS